MSTTHPGAPERAPDRGPDVATTVAGVHPGTSDPQPPPDRRGVAGWQWQRWHLEEAYRFGEGVLPELDRRGLLAARPS